jgi:hypothetical protein
MLYTGASSIARLFLDALAYVTELVMHFALAKRFGKFCGYG